MKKWFVLIGICFLITISFINKEKTSEAVFEETNTNEFKLVKIDVSNASITTKNFASLLNSVTLYKVTYEIPKLYKSKFANQNPEYSFLGVSNQKGLEEIEKILSKKMKEMGSVKEVERIAFYGVKLLSIEVYGRSGKIEELKQKLKDY